MTTELLFTYHASQRTSFRGGKIAEEWSSRYPELFDQKDIELAANQPDYHFFEWLSAILIYESTGYLSLLENYTAKNHPSKLHKFQEMVSSEVFEYSMKNQSGMPDLFCFHAGTTKGGLKGFDSGETIEGTTDRTEEVYQAVRKIKPDIILIAHGSALVRPEDGQYVLDHTSGHGIWTGSSTERIPIEKAVLEAARQFTSLTFKN